MVVGQIASGTNIPPNDPVQLVSRGTAPVTLAAPVTQAAGAWYLALPTTLTISPWEAIKDTTAPTAIPGGTGIVSIPAAAGAPASVTGTAGAAAQQVITVSSGGTGCVPGMLVFDTTTPALLLQDTRVIASTGTSITVNRNIQGGGIGGSDSISCYPTVQLQAALAAAVTAGDTITVTPAVYLQLTTLSTGLGSGAAVSFAGNTSTVSSAVTTTGSTSTGNAGIYINGQPFIRSFGGYAAVDRNPGSSLSIGLGAAAALGPNGANDIFIGENAGLNMIVGNGGNGTQSTIIGGEAAKLTVDGNSLTILGHAALGNCVGGPQPASTTQPPAYACSSIVAVGTDALLYSQHVNSMIVIGPRGTASNEDGFENIIIGGNSLQGMLGDLSVDYDNVLLCWSCAQATAGTLNGIHDNVMIGVEMAGGSPSTMANNVFYRRQVRGECRSGGRDNRQRRRMYRRWRLPRG